MKSCDGSVFWTESDLVFISYLVGKKGTLKPQGRQVCHLVKGSWSLIYVVMPMHND
jgi:hypothetical protein